MHQQEVGGVGLSSLCLGHTGGHGDSGNTRRADEGIDFAPGDEAEEFSQQHAASGGEAEGHKAQGDDPQGLGPQEHQAVGGGAHSGAQHDGDDVAEGVLGGVREALHTTGLPEQVAQHQHTDERSHRGQHQHAEDGDHNGEDNLFGLAHLPQLVHLNLPLLLGGKHPHNGRLDERNQGHVGVGGHRNGGQQLRGQAVGEEDGSGSVGAANDGDGGRLGGGEHGLATDDNVVPQEVRQGEGHVDTELGGGPQQEADGVGDKGTKVGHCAHAHKDEAGEDAGLNPHVDDAQHAGVVPGQALGGGVVHKARQGEVRQQHTKGDGQQQQGLEALFDGHVQQDEGDQDHDPLLPGHRYKARLREGLRDDLKKIHIRFLPKP